MKSLTGRMNEGTLNEDVTFEIPGYKSFVDKLTKDPDKFFRQAAEVFYETGLGRLNSSMRNLYHRDSYLRSNLDFAAWFASMRDVKYSAADVKKFLSLYEFMYKSHDDETFFGNMNDNGIFSTLKVLYITDGKITHGFDGFGHEFKKHNLR